MRYDGIGVLKSMGNELRNRCGRSAVARRKFIVVLCVQKRRGCGKGQGGILSCGARTFFWAPAATTDFVLARPVAASSAPLSIGDQGSTIAASGD